MFKHLYFYTIIWRRIPLERSLMWRALTYIWSYNMLFFFPRVLGILISFFDFSFVVNPLTPVQETLCQLQNDTSANNPNVAPQRSVNMYYMVKLQMRSENVCLRPWAFERVPNKIIRGLDNALIYTSTKEACLAACLNEVNDIKIKVRLILRRKRL